MLGFKSINKPMNTFLKTSFAAFILAATATLEASPPLVLTNVNLIDVRNETIRFKQTLVIDQDRIQRIVPAQEYQSIQGSREVDLTDHFIIPGLIDGHVHHATDPDSADNLRQTQQRLRELLKGGVTSVRDMGGDARVLAYLKRQAQLDQIPAPDIYHSVIIGGPEFFKDPRTVSSAKGHQAGQTHWMRSVTDSSNFEEVILTAKGINATGIKIYAEVSEKQIQKLRAAANKYGMKVWAHSYVGPAKPSEIVNAKVDAISHAPDLAAEFIPKYKEWRRKNASVSDQIIKRAFESEGYRPLFTSMKQNNVVLDATLTVFEQQKDRNKNTATRYQLAKELTKQAYQNGVKISAGTDAFSDLSGKDYPMIHYEMKLLVNDASLTPLAAIKAATLNNAEIIGKEKELGSIEVGKIANLVVLKDNPKDNIQATRKIAHVIKNGQFIYRGIDPQLPFTAAKESAGTLFLSGQLGNLPGTMTLAGDSIELQMHQTMKNIAAVLHDYQLTFDDLTKCTLMLNDIKDWATASDIYRSYFPNELPARSAFAASGLALNAKVEVECMANL